MQTDTHIEVISQYHCYDCSRHTGMNFYESPCQMRVNPMICYTVVFGVPIVPLQWFNCKISRPTFRYGPI